MVRTEGEAMSNRITRKDAEQALRVYCNRAGLPFGHYLTIKNDDELQHLIDTDPGQGKLPLWWEARP